MIVVCEGLAERAFVNNVLRPYAAKTYQSVSAPLVGKKISGHGGGDVGWNRLGKELPDYLSQGHSVVTTFIDLFRLKSNMPGYLPPGSAPGRHRAESVEQAMASMLSRYVQHPGHFVPYVQVHEYEALLFSDPDAFELATGHAESARRIKQVNKKYPNPEEINGEKSPGLWLTEWYHHDYRKPVDGLLAAEAIGIPAMRAACPRFDAWLTSLGLAP